ncbi:hydroxymethylglutaryl-CoA lyase [Rhodoflexus caldus]|uniref:hydroxymethylglutaryl-CoA lyase n=1 Tax=Rhodoflexus caldus TaxID=2891236 RepID=UPI00202A07FA|nr:hydroxymethylglutaryl-CoA lyase [Rhodoflexus caldus]
MYPSEVILEEQGLRDGLQVESTLLPTEKKVELIHRLMDAGLKRIQVGSFVNPKLVPQMADTAAVFAAIQQRPDVSLNALVLNTKGVERAVEAGFTHVAASISASDTHSRKNANKSLEEAMTEFESMVRTAKAAGMRVRGGLQCAFGCRYEGEIPAQRVLDLSKRHLDLGIDEIALADSTGMGNPRQMEELMGQIVEMAGHVPVMLHLHDTEGKGLANVVAAMRVGVRHFDTAFGGLGGCPFIKGATGNIATEDTAYMLEEMDIRTGIDIAAIVAITREMEEILGKKLPGKIKNVLG